MPQVMEEIETRAVSDAISERILKLISSGALQPGDSLPPQRKLAGQLGVSLSSLREALHALAAVGVIDVKHGLGTFVCAHATDPLVRQLDWAVLLQSEETRELMEARRVLDVSVARLAAERATEEQVAYLTELLAGMMECWRARDVACLEEQDIQLHLAVARAAGNSLLSHLAQTLYAVVDPFIRVVPHTQAGLDNHRRVLEAIAAHDPVKAEEAMRVLLDETERLYRQRDDAEFAETLQVD
jgi:GntR family transcriptional repressor for pyruvate dehydrogenase complex